MLNCAIQALYHNDLHRWRNKMAGVVKVLIEALSSPAIRFLHQFMWVVMETMCCCRYDCKNVDWIVIGAWSLGFSVKEIWSVKIQFEQFVHRIFLHCQGLEYYRLQMIQKCDCATVYKWRKESDSKSKSEIWTENRSDWPVATALWLAYRWWSRSGLLV